MTVASTDCACPPCGEGCPPCGKKCGCEGDVLVPAGTIVLDWDLLQARGPLRREEVAGGAVLASGDWRFSSDVLVAGLPRTPRGRGRQGAIGGPAEEPDGGGWNAVGGGKVSLSRTGDGRTPGEGDLSEEDRRAAKAAEARKKLQETQTESIAKREQPGGAKSAPATTQAAVARLSSTERGSGRQTAAGAEAAREAKEAKREQTYEPGRKGDSRTTEHAVTSFRDLAQERGAEAVVSSTRGAEEKYTPSRAAALRQYVEARPRQVREAPTRAEASPSAFGESAQVQERDASPQTAVFGEEAPVPAGAAKPVFGGADAESGGRPTSRFGEVSNDGGLAASAPGDVGSASPVVSDYEQYPRHSADDPIRPEGSSNGPAAGGGFAASGPSGVVTSRPIVAMHDDEDTTLVAGATAAGSDGETDAEGAVVAGSPSGGNAGGGLGGTPRAAVEAAEAAFQERISVSLRAPGKSGTPGLYSSPWERTLFEVRVETHALLGALQAAAEKSRGLGDTLADPKVAFQFGALGNALRQMSAGLNPSRAARLRQTVVRALARELHAQRVSDWKKSGRQGPRPRERDSEAHAEFLVRRAVDGARSPGPSFAPPLRDDSVSFVGANCPCPCDPGSGRGSSGTGEDGGSKDGTGTGGGTPGEGGGTPGGGGARGGGIRGELISSPVAELGGYRGFAVGGRDHFTVAPQRIAQPDVRSDPWDRGRDFGGMRDINVVAPPGLESGFDVRALPSDEGRRTSRSVSPGPSDGDAGAVRADAASQSDRESEAKHESDVSDAADAVIAEFLALLGMEGVEVPEGLREQLRAMLRPYLFRRAELLAKAGAATLALLAAETESEKRRALGQLAEAKFLTDVLAVEMLGAVFAKIQQVARTVGDLRRTARDAPVTARFVREFRSRAEPGRSTLGAMSVALVRRAVTLAQDDGIATPTGTEKYWMQTIADHPQVARLVRREAKGGQWDPETRKNLGRYTDAGKGPGFFEALIETIDGEIRKHGSFDCWVRWTAVATVEVASFLVPVAAAARAAKSASWIKAALQGAGVSTGVEFGADLLRQRLDLELDESSAPQAAQMAILAGIGDIALAGLFRAGSRVLSATDAIQRVKSALGRPSATVRSASVQAHETAAVPRDRVPLWRAVGEAELADIRARGAFRIPDSSTVYENVKLFAETAEGAGKEARGLGTTIARDQRFTVVRTDIDADRFKELYVFPDTTTYGPVPTRAVPRELLPELSPPQVQDVIIFKKP